MASLMLGALPVPSQSLNLSSRVSFSRTETLSVALSTPIPVSASPQTLPLVYCGRGDKKTAKGKRFNHSYGNARPRNKKKGRGPPRVTSPPSPRKKDRFDDDEAATLQLVEGLLKPRSVMGSISAARIRTAFQTLAPNDGWQQGSPSFPP